MTAQLITTPYSLLESQDQIIATQDTLSEFWLALNGPTKMQSVGVSQHHSTQYPSHAKKNE